MALPRRWAPARLQGLQSGWWALVPAISVIGFVAIGSAAEAASATALTYIALVAVPLLAALALGWLMHGARPLLVLLVPAAFALAWADRGGLAGESAATALSALSCVALGAMIAAVTPTRWLALGIVAMALADSALVISDLLQQPNNALNAAHPPAGLPRLQAELFGSAEMGYGDLFVAGVLGGLLAWFAADERDGARVLAGAGTLQSRGGLLVALLAIAFDLLFFAVDELPATVPVALGLLILLRIGSPSGRSSSEEPAGAGWDVSGRGAASIGVGPARSRSDLAPASSIRRS